MPTYLVHGEQVRTPSEAIKRSISVGIERELAIIGDIEEHRTVYLNYLREHVGKLTTIGLASTGDLFQLCLALGYHDTKYDCVADLIGDTNEKEASHKTSKEQDVISVRCSCAQCGAIRSGV